MYRILSGAAALLIGALPARADQRQPAPSTDVKGGTASPDEHARAEGHWDPDHVEKSERRTGKAAGRRAIPSRSELHRKSERRADGSTRTEEERSEVKETIVRDASGKIVSDQKKSE